MRLNIIFLTMVLGLSSCAYLQTGNEETDPASAATGKDGAPALQKVSPTDALELRVAQLSSRVDDLEAQLQKQKERGKLLEKGLLLGIVPDELKSDDEKPKSAIKKLQNEAKHSPLEIQGAEGVSVASSPPASGAAAASGGTSHDQELYRKMLQEAQDKFNRANYGQAIVAFNDIGSKFDDSVTEGNHFYWIGLSWYYLKEYKLAEESFQSLRTRYPTNPWSNYAGFYMAKIEQSRGLSQRAMDQFQKILDENPDRDLGEMARSEIAKMKEKL